MKSIVGYSGFVGSNICSQEKFDSYYNSQNIGEAYGSNPDILLYTGMRAEKHLANQFPDKDKQIVAEAIENIKKINPKQVILISTIDVYKNPIDVDEDSYMDTENLHPYGYNRYVLEQWVTKNIENHLIIRLPALIGKNIKKNFIYDYIQKIPSMLKQEKIEELAKSIPTILNYYTKMENGFYQCVAIEKEERKFLRELLKKTSFSAIDFTDSRAVFQFYDLKYLWKDIKKAMELEIQCLNLATQPISASEIYEHLEGKKFVNEIINEVPYYDFKTKYAACFGGQNGYLESKDSVIRKIKEFVNDEISNL